MARNTDPTRHLAERIPYPVVATNLAGVFGTPASDEQIDPARAAPADRTRHGMLWRRPDGDAPASVRQAWSAAFARPWPAERRIIPHSVPHRGTSHTPPSVVGRTGGSTTSPWAGAVLEGQWTSVVGVWNVPTVSEPRAPIGDRDDWEVVSWIGLDGLIGSDDVLQVGISQVVDEDGDASAFAWYEWWAPEVPGSPDYVWQTEIDNFEVAPGDTVWATVQYAGTLPPAASTTLIAYESQYSDQYHVDYLTPDGHVQELLYRDDVWHWTDLMTQVPGNVTVAGPGSPLVGYATEYDSKQHVFYFDSKRRVQELLYDDGWVHNDVFDHCSGNPVPAASDRLVGYISSWNDQHHLNYFDRDGHVHELYVDRHGWHHNDLFTQCSGSPVPAVPNSSIAAFTSVNEQLHVIYTAADGHVHELLYTDDDGWKHNDLFSLCDEPPVPAESGRGLEQYETTFARNQQWHVNYTDASGHVHELVYSDRWYHNDLTIKGIGAPTRVDSPLAGFQTGIDEQQHVIYFDGLQGVRELVFRYYGQTWTSTDFSEIAPWSVFAAATSPLTGWVSSNEQEHVNFVDMAGHVHELYYKDGWIQNDLSSMATLTGVMWFGNDRTREHFSITLLPPAGASFQGNTAEWIVETPIHSENNELATLPKFTDITFTSALCCGPGGYGNPSTASAVAVIEDGLPVTSADLGTDTVIVSYIGP